MTGSPPLPGALLLCGVLGWVTACTGCAASSERDAAHVQDAGPIIEAGTHPKPDGGSDAGTALAVAPGETELLSAGGTSYADPEILETAHKLTFSDQNGTVWVGDLDPLTGRFVSGDGRDLRVADDGAALTITNNGPEFGIDASGWSVIFSKRVGPAVQTWRAVPTAGGTGVQTTPLTSGPQQMGAVASKHAGASSLRVAAVRGNWTSGELIWFDAATPSDAHVLAEIDNMDSSDARWIDGSLSLVQTIREAPNRGQLMLLDTTSGRSQRITDDAGNKTRPYGWAAPESAGDVRVLALVDLTKLAVYERRGGFFARTLEVPIPAGSGGIELGSPEPFVVDNRSFASITVMTSTTRGSRDAQIWVVDLGTEPRRAPFRCDDGAVGPVRRLDPETYRGREQTFVYYYVPRTGGGFDLYRCATGLQTSLQSAERN